MVDYEVNERSTKFGGVIVFDNYEENILCSTESGYRVGAGESGPCWLYRTISATNTAQLRLFWLSPQINKAKLPTHVELKAEKFGLDKDSVILGEQIRTIDKARLKQRIASWMMSLWPRSTRPLRSAWPSGFNLKPFKR